MAATTKPSALEPGRLERWIDYFLEFGVSLAPLWLFVAAMIALLVAR